jgi:glyoxylase-like metal-dependent hydrolase (beta-lactamase superfamily II)
MQKGELAHAHEQHERDRVSYLTDNYDPLVRNGQVVILDGDSEIAPGISVQLYPGHTAYHMAVILESNGKRACYIGDLIPTTAHIHPTWVMGYDLDPIACIDNRHRFYKDAIPERWLVIFTHDPKVPWAYVGKDADGKYAIETL